MVDRISSSALNLNSLRYINDTSVRLSKLNIQVSSGNKAQTFSEISGAVERVSGFQEQVSRIDNYLSNNIVVSTRLNATNNSLDQVQQVAQEFLSNAALYNPSTQNSYDLVAAGQSALNRIQDALNVTVSGSYVFSGSNTTQSPISDINAPLTASGVADDNYYTGDNITLSARISDSFELQYGVQANDPALQNLISGIRTAMQGATDNNLAMVRSGQSLVEDSKTQLATLRAEVNTNITSLESVNDQHRQLKVFWNESLSNDLDTDIAEATIKVTENETILQASFQVFARLSQLKLTDFL